MHESTHKGPKPQDVPLEYPKSSRFILRHVRYEGHDMVPRKIHGDREASITEKALEESNAKKKLERQLKRNELRVKRGQVHNPSVEQE